jgi:hypothetical protein
MSGAPTDAPDPVVRFGVAPEQLTTEPEHGHSDGLGWLLHTLGFSTLNREAVG